MSRLERVSTILGNCALLFVLVISVGCGSTSKTGSTPTPGPTNSPSPTPTPTPTPTPPPPATDKDLVTEDVATGLTVPWSLAFAPDGRLFFTEQPGRLRVITSQGLLATPLLDLTATTAGGEAGTTGMDLDKNFATNGFLYMHYCLKTPFHCQVVRVIVTPQNTATIDKVLLDYPVVGQSDHTGGRLKVGPDNLLYLSTGDHRIDMSAQDLTSWNGKILRMNLDGTPAAGNPFPQQNPFVYSYGHRDPQGLAFDSSGQLYETEHGPVSNDEVNIIFKGKNYGWPLCVGICHNPAFVDPIKLFNPQTAPPSGATFYYGATIPGWDGTFLFAVLGLDGNTFAHHVHQLKFDKPGGTTITFEQILWQNVFGRIRDVAEGPDGFLYFSTSNIGQSANPHPGDDRIVRARPK